MQNKVKSKKDIFLLGISVLGVVYGDIGTSPLYAIHECFHSDRIPISHDNILGILSLIFYSLLTIICVKYMGIVLRANNKGEGGILALTALITPSRNTSLSKRVVVLTIMGLFGAALLYGDGVITPAISVLSAIEGLKVVTPFFEPYIIPITLTIITFLFFIQQKGTSKIGALFGPLMLIWFLALAALGIRGILHNPEVFNAINPYYGFNFLVEEKKISFYVLASVFLVVTGGEALYADMGHFGRKPIQWTWFACVFPALILNYFGQGALLLEDPTALENPFFRLAPSWAVLPLVILAAMATCIASQAVISGIYSLTRQAIQLGFCPRLKIVHTSSNEIGQIYVPQMNWLLYICTILVVLNFRSSSDLAAAYGIAVSTTMVITTLLVYFVIVRLWKWNPVIVIPMILLLLAIDLIFFLSNITKVGHGGWLPLTGGIVVYVLMSTWRKGRQILGRRLRERALPFEKFLDYIAKAPPTRVPGTAVYMTSVGNGVPAALLNNLKFNKILHERIVIITVLTIEEPYHSKENHIEIEAIASHIYKVVIRYGFMEIPNLPLALKKCEFYGLAIDIEEATFFLGRETLLATKKAGMALWREHLFSFMSTNAQRATTFFNIPTEQVVEIGIQVEL